MDHKEGALSKKKEHRSHEGGGGEHRSGGHPHVHFHKHDGGVTAHVMHHDGTHEIHHFDHGDSAGMGALLAEHMGAAPAPGAGAPGMEPAEHMAQGASPAEEQAEQAA